MSEISGSRIEIKPPFNSLPTYGKLNAESHGARNSLPGKKSMLVVLRELESIHIFEFQKCYRKRRWIDLAFKFIASDGYSGRN